ncbi:hypothetical protein BD413DRAFT_608863 [Trametes elegans]|nr:hypothetical protein BD413DRAFT_608863 [Trametes elegans]
MKHELVNEKPPAYSKLPTIVPTTPLQNDRYERQALVASEYMVISKGPHRVSNAIPGHLAGWTPTVNPEGSLYFVDKDRHIVTDVPADRLNGIIPWAQYFAGLAKVLDIHLPESYELYLNPDAEGASCKYYYIDHVNQSVFWLQDIDQYDHDMELPPTCSAAHMRYVLQEQYWRHCEYFPHRAVPRLLRDELIHIFVQARADLLTSSMSTFPYSVEETKCYLEVLQMDSQSNEYTNWILARFWATIARHRYTVFYGEDHAKISRDQQRYDKRPVQHSRLLKIYAALLFNIPRLRTEELNLLFVDDVAFGMHWREFAVAMLRDWHEASFMCMGLTIAGAVSSLRPMNPVSAALGSVSVVLALGGLATSALLLLKYNGAEKQQASATAEHLALIEHPKYGFQPVAVVHSVPRALVFWSMFFFAGHVLSILVDPMNVVTQAPAIVLALLVALGLFKAHTTVRDGFPEDGPKGFIH